jgi:hypothetical protein
MGGLVAEIGRTPSEPDEEAEDAPDDVASPLIPRLLLVLLAAVLLAAVLLAAVLLAAVLLAAVLLAAVLLAAELVVFVTGLQPLSKIACPASFQFHE